MTRSSRDPTERPSATGADGHFGSGLLSGSAINFAGLVVGSASQFGVVLVLAQTLAKAEAGLFLIGFAVFRIAVGFFGLGLNVTAVRYVALSLGRDDAEAASRASRTVLWMSIAAGTVGAVLLATSSGLFISAFHSDQVRGILFTLALGIPFSTFTLTAAGSARGAQRTTSAIILEQVADSGFRFIGLCIGLAMTDTALGAAIGFTAGGAVAAMAAVWVTRDDWRGRGLVSGSELRDLLRFTGFQWGTVFTGAAFRWADAVLLGLWRTPSEVAVYSTATRAIWLGMVFVMPIGLAFQPIIARLAEERDFASLRSLYRSAARLATAIGSTPLLLTGVCAAPFLAAVYGSGYKSGAIALTFLAVGQAINAAAGPAATVVTMVGRADLTLRFNAIALVADVALNIVLIPLFGMSGAGAAWFLSLSLLCGLRFNQCRSEIGVQIFDGWLVRAIFSIVVGVAASEAAIRSLQGGSPWLAATAGFAVGATVAFGTMLCLGLRIRDISPRRTIGVVPSTG